MTKLTSDQKKLVEHAQALEGLNVHIKEDTSPSGLFEYVTVTVDYDAEWYDIKQSVVLSASRFEGGRARQSARRTRSTIDSFTTKSLKIREVRSAAESLWLWNTEAGKEEQRRIEKLFSR